MLRVLASIAPGAGIADIAAIARIAPTAAVAAAIGNRCDWLSQLPCWQLPIAAAAAILAAANSIAVIAFVAFKLHCSHYGYCICRFPLGGLKNPPLLQPVRPFHLVRSLRPFHQFHPFVVAIAAIATIAAIAATNG